ncbi:hypothetical protein IPH92_05125 [Candidatus Kaiserbacteria bacterium]|nr:MAG: hypothetical protein IPH92_05125 [Candidatus Kaiserbacteria bacterium]
MRILLVTPLYPPDIAGPAPYVKELATRLDGAHTITILAYSHIPEIVSGVAIVTVEKRFPAPIRMSIFAWKLRTLLKETDVVYLQNGPSVEVPFTFVSLFSHIPSVLRLGDSVALTHAVHNRLFRMILIVAMRRVHLLITPENIPPEIETLIQDPKLSQKCICIHNPDIRPEIHPFHEYPQSAFLAYEASWEKHITSLITSITSHI